jgi:hypothetical protein
VTWQVPVPPLAVKVDPDTEQSPEVTLKLTVPVPVPPEAAKVAVSP